MIYMIRAMCLIRDQGKFIFSSILLGGILTIFFPSCLNVLAFFKTSCTMVLLVYFTLYFTLGMEQYKIERKDD